ncbi:hypothetical protein JCM8202v2_002198 [Rhodotorula sphaerocarpa]
MAILHDNFPRGLCNMLPMLALFTCVAVGSPAFKPPFIVAVGISTACVAVCAQHRAEGIVLDSASGSDCPAFTFFTALWACWRWGLSAVTALNLPVPPEFPTTMGALYAVVGPLTAIGALICWLSDGGALSADEAAKLNAGPSRRTTSATDLEANASPSSSAPAAASAPEASLPRSLPYVTADAHTGSFFQPLQSTERAASPPAYPEESEDPTSGVDVPLLRRDK